MEEGWFTGKRLIDYINDQIKDYYNARRIINGTDKADEIKQIAEEFEHILKSSITQPASSGISQLEPSVSHNDPPLQTTNDA
ncbi:hypothetical protein KJJ93_29975, partial [Escherichia coli]|nr:hypothetical protein [Escherichia coli]